MPISTWLGGEVWVPNAMRSSDSTRQHDDDAGETRHHQQRRGKERECGKEQQRLHVERIARRAIGLRRHGRERNALLREYRVTDQEERASHEEHGKPRNVSTALRHGLLVPE